MEEAIKNYKKRIDITHIASIVIFIVCMVLRSITVEIDGVIYKVPAEVLLTLLTCAEPLLITYSIKLHNEIMKIYEDAYIFSNEYMDGVK